MATSLSRVTAEVIWTNNRLGQLKELDKGLKRAVGNDLQRGTIANYASSEARLALCRGVTRNTACKDTLVNKPLGSSYVESERERFTGVKALVLAESSLSRLDCLFQNPRRSCV